MRRFPLDWTTGRPSRCCAAGREAWPRKHTRNSLKPVQTQSGLTRTGEAVLLLGIEPYCLTMAKTMTRVNRVSDSMKARPSTRKSMMPARAPGLRASASVAEAVALP